MIAVLLALLDAVFDPATAARVVAGDREDLARTLVRTCWRESRCRAVGVHERDRRWSRSMYAASVRVGWLRPESCSWHSPDYEWSTSGPFGLVRAYNLRELAPFDCVPPQVLDVPIIAAVVARRRLVRRRGGCGRPCTYKRAREIWGGGGA